MPKSTALAVAQRIGRFLLYVIPALLLIFAFGAWMYSSPAHAAPAAETEKPSAWFCIKARMHRAQFSTDKAAEDAARAQGATQATINKAHRCKP